MMIQVDWDSGRLVREYTALLDPPGYSANANPVNNAEISEKKQAPRDNAVDQATESELTDKPARKAPGKRPYIAKRMPDVAEGNAYRVKRGDTLVKIAQRNPVPGVNLDQMLIGLYRANKNAFIEGNINRLKVGHIIRTPVAAELQTIDKQEANKEVQIQVANWNAYRNNLASTVVQSAASESEAPKQNASGKITKLADDKGVSTAAPRDVVKLSKGDAGKANASTAELQSALQEEAIASQRKIKEANERIVALTKQLEDMQKLLELKSQAMAELQKAAGQPAAEPSKETPEQKVTETLPAVEPVKVDEKASEQHAVQPAADKPQPKKIVTAPPAVKTSAPPPPVEKGWLDYLQENAVILGGAAAALALLVGGWLFVRNRRMRGLDKFEQGILTTGLNAKTVFGSTAGGTVDTGDTSFLTAFTQGAGGMIDTHDVDPLAEAEVYMAYGREAQAEEILKDAIVKEPSRYDLHLKLLEIYAGRKDTSAFEAIAGELYTTLGATNPVWLKVAAIGHELEPANPLYQTDSASEKSEEKPEEKPEEKQEESKSIETKQNTDEEAPNLLDASKPESSDLELTTNGIMEFAETETFPEIPQDTDSLLDQTEELKDLSSLNFEEDALTLMTEPEIIKNNDEALELNSDFDLNKEEIPDEVISIEDVPVDTLSADKDDLNDLNDIDFSLDLPELQPEKSDIDNELGTKPILAESIISTAMDSKQLLAEELAFKIELPDTAVNTDTTKLTSEVPEVTPEKSAEAKADDLNFNFDISFDETEKNLDVTLPSAENTLQELDLSGINLDLDAPVLTPESDVSASNIESTEVDTKLDLVTAYIDMDDKEGARELLEEVLKEGGPQQRQKAQQILDGLA